MLRQWTRLERWLRARLLPPVMEPGAMPLFSLSYLLMLFMPAFVDGPRMPRTDWVLTSASVVLFLPLYFRFYWERGWRRIGMIVAIHLLGLALLPANVFASVYVIFTWVLAAHLRWRPMLLTLAVTMASSVLPYLFLETPLQVWFWGTVFPGVLASMGCKIWFNAARRNEALRLSQEELAHMARVAERERIGRDLHDLLGHTLSVIALKSELAGKLIGRDAGAAVEEMREVERISRKALMEVRRAVTGMRTPGMLAEMANIKVAMNAALVEFEYDAEPLVLSQEIEGVLGFVVREGATNVIRHAHARRCRLLIKRNGDRVRMEMEDDGRGGVVETGNGLRGLRERIETVGGDLEIVSPLGGGTRLVAHLPANYEPNGEPQPRVSLKLVSSR